MRLRADVRSRTRCIRRRSRSRNARSSSEGSHSAGTRSRRHNSASTRASTLSVLHANGAMSRTLRAWATSTFQPAAASRSRTQTAPLIISTHARTSGPTVSTSRATVLVGRHHPLAADRAAVAERAPRRAPIRPIDADILHRGASLHGLSYRPTLSLLRGGPPSRRKGLRHDIPWVSTLASTCRVGAAALLHSPEGSGGERRPPAPAPPASRSALGVDRHAR